MADFLLWLKGWAEWVDAMPNSIALRESIYVWSYILLAHVVSMCLFAGTVVMMDLRLLGIGNMQTPFSQVQSRLFPWQMLGMAGSALTGVVLLFAKPMEYYGNVFFWMKAIMMLLAGVNALAFHYLTYFSVDRWDTGSTPPFGAKLAGGLGVVLWAGVIVTGRLLPYNWFK
jgi:hypothetical protein